MLEAGLLRVIPGNPETPVDIVPVDVVAERILLCVRNPEALDATVWVTSGIESPTLERLLDISLVVMRQAGNEALTRPRFIRPGAYQRVYRPLLMREFSGAQRLLLETVEQFLPYFEHGSELPTTAGLSKLELETVWKRSVEFYLTKHRVTRGRGQAALRPRSLASRSDEDASSQKL
jgi:hypothetical protein